MNDPDYSNYFNLHPDQDGRFGKYGGAYIPPPLEIIMAEIDHTLMEDVRRNWPFLRDRRIDAYGDITKRFID